MCTYITHIAFHAPLEFDQTDIPRCRQHIARRILANTYCINPSTTIPHPTASPVPPPLGKPMTSPDTHATPKSASITPEPHQNQRRSARPPKPKKPFSPEAHQPRAQKIKPPPNPKPPTRTHHSAASPPADTISRTPPSKTNRSPLQQRDIARSTPATRPPGPPHSLRRKPLPRTLGAPPFPTGPPRRRTPYSCPPTTGPTFLSPSPHDPPRGVSPVSAPARGRDRGPPSPLGRDGLGAGQGGGGDPSGAPPLSHLDDTTRCLFTEGGAPSPSRAPPAAPPPPAATPLPSDAAASRYTRLHTHPG